jgi:hypothetical protein
MTDFDDDPLNNLNERLTRQEQQEQFNQFAQTVSAQVNAFKQVAPDYDEALEHVRNTRAEELRAMGPPEVDIPKVIDAESVYLAQTSMQAGKNPGMAVYAMALKRGFQGEYADNIAHASHDPSGDILQQALAETFARGHK